MATAKNKRPKIDWPRARIMCEVEGLSNRDIAKQLHCRHQTVSAHANKEGWVRNSAATRAGQLAIEKFVERDSEAVAQTLSGEHRLAETLKAAVEHNATVFAKHIKDNPTIPINPLELRRTIASLGDIEKINHSLAGLSDVNWRTGGTGGGEDPEAEERAIQAVLEEPEED